MRVDVGSMEELKSAGCLTAKAGSQPVCVVWHDGRPYAVDDRCPHMGFPLHRGTVENGLLTCHWHHARFDLDSGGTLDPWADDVRAYPVSVEDGRVVLHVEPEPDRRAHYAARLEEGLEQGLTLVTAKAVLALLEAGEPPASAVRLGVEFGSRYRGAGWGAGLTVLVAMANLLPHLDPADRPLALVHGLAFVSRDTAGRAPFFPLTPLPTKDVSSDRLGAWYRRFVETRNGDGAERALRTAVDSADLSEVASAMTAAATDHVFIDGGHTLDFTNKAFESVELLGSDVASLVLPTLVHQTAAARRHEEEGPWRHPVDLAQLIREAELRVGSGGFAESAVAPLAWRLLDEDARAVIDALESAAQGGATPEQLSRALAFAAALRITRFHTQNDHADWDEVHHGFTYANALHQCVSRAPSALLLRGVLHGAMKVYLDRFLNIPPARLPQAPRKGDAPPDLADLSACWDQQGMVDEAGGIVYRYAMSGADPSRVVAALGHALLAEDAEFHWFQTVEAAVRQFTAWPQGSEEGALILAGAARFLAAHTPTRRELPQVVRIATRLRRGEALFEEE